MEISGQRLSIPRNFFFLNRLPSRFEILVVGKGAVSPKGTAFELEIQGQRLVLRSKVDLKVGARYELEKISTLEFRILSEIGEERKEAVLAEAPPREKKEGSDVSTSQFLLQNPVAGYDDILGLKVFDESGHKIERMGEKYTFGIESQVPLRGVFVPYAAGYRLFISGNADSEALAALLSPLGIQSVRSVSAAVLERISLGAIDIST